jgi:hypothetical protein
MEIDIMTLGLLIWGAWSAGCWWTNQQTKRNMKELLDDLGVPQDAQKDLPAKFKTLANGPRPIVLTKVGKQFYAHCATTEAFLGQADTRDDLFKFIAQEHGEGKYEVVDNT